MTFWIGCTPARTAFVTKFRILIGAMHSGKQGSRALQLAIPPSTLSNYWSGRRMPRVRTLRGMYDAVRANSSTADMPVTLAELEALRMNALTDSRARDTQAACAIAGSLPEARTPQAAAEPSGGHPAGGPAAGPAQDRRSTENGKVLETLEVLRSARASGDLRHLIGTAWSASRTLSQTEFCEAVGALHASADVDLAEALLLADGQRDADDTMRLALALMAAGLASSAELIMRASLPSGGDVRR
ncbi:hypothetical protein PV371_05310 [Streptomyces sp. TX20-6-3]|uniref:hypothetical protein n=1 Tax=Streptomyces sp. TX20-6-3 TaxID=3028705 RepID=UPI0029AA720C|nr:hypothetical protein [Streptomyces sp. TX20-6-3]MDX2559065.1 hypothetical protein [Streptomyces sp. TX20-6-3]